MGKININARIDELFDDLETKMGVRLVRDGVINPLAWDEAPRKVLFILKERNLNAVQTKKIPADELYDFRLSCRRGNWRVLGQWAYSLQRPDARPSFSEADQNHVQAFHASAIINLKKTPGNESSKTEDILASAGLFKDILNQQIDLLRPDVILCGGRGSVLNIARSVLGRSCEGWIDFYHPSCRLNRRLMYDALMGL